MAGFEPHLQERGWPASPATVLDILAGRAERDPAAHQFSYLGEDGSVRPLSVGEVAERAARVASFLVARGVGRGEEVILLLPPDESFLFGLLGTQRAGAVAAAIYPPSSPSRLAEQAGRALAIIADSGARTVLTVRLLLPFARILAARLPALQRLLLVEEALAAPAGPLPPLPGPDEIAFLQYSSGSTGAPKGVVVLHRNLMAQLRLLGQAVPALHDPQRQDVQRVVSWLPPYHDMGLIGCIFYPICWGIVSYLASPLSFIRKPWLWLQWCSRFRATQTVAPNFAYQRCAARLRDRDLEGLDLSSLEVAWNGAEPVLPEVVRRFAERFAPCGFRPQAAFPVYGLAEFTLCVTHPLPGEGARFDRILHRPWEEQGLAVPAPDAEPALEITSVGVPGAGTEVRIADEQGRPLPERQRGEICVRGGSLMPGYHRREPGEEWHPGGWLRTGDLGYLADGHLHVAGRLKDLIIVGGRNFFPHDIEHAAAEVPGVRSGRVVAFGVPEADRGTESVVVCTETEPPDMRADDDRALKRHIRLAVEDAIGLAPGRVELVPAGWVDKTSSGKLRRGISRERYLAERAAAGGDGEEESEG